MSEVRAGCPKLGHATLVKGEIFKKFAERLVIEKETERKEKYKATTAQNLSIFYIPLQIYFQLLMVINSYHKNWVQNSTRVPHKSYICTGGQITANDHGK